LLGRPVRGFCYPNGDFDARVAGAVRSAGYDYAAGTRPVRNGRGSDRFALGRIDVTAHAVCDPDGSYDELSFRGEVCLFHGALR
jgi:peptidoglycan/xylan/chitin deacetylase (PgdA/CDA1 family)